CGRDTDRGARHALFCLGCCWMLMTLLFVGGVMNLAWVGGIAVLVLLEKTMPLGDWMSRLTGVIFILRGGGWLARIIWNRAYYMLARSPRQRAFLPVAVACNE